MTLNLKTKSITTLTLSSTYFEHVYRYHNHFKAPSISCDRFKRPDSTGGELTTFKNLYNST